MEFRAQALAKLEEPEDLDLPVRLTRPRSWLALGALGLVVLATLVWAFVGDMPQRVAADGVMVYPQGGFLLKTTSAGPVRSVFVQRGQTVVAGDAIAAVGAGSAVEIIRSGAAGRISEVLVQPGQPVGTGSAVAVVERGQSLEAPLVAVLYLPSDEATRVSAGRTADLEVRSAPAETYGYLRGRVLAVGLEPQDQAEIAGFLGDDELARKFAGDGEPMKVVVQLEQARTPSGFAWSVGQGPPYPIRSRTLVAGEVRLPSLRPISAVLP